jgi:hypothetical protein
MDNIFKLAEHEVDNKGLLTRIAHSSKFHATRSALQSKGSFGSKLIRAIGTAGRAVAGCIPLPLAGGLIATVEKAIESKIRSKIHEMKRDKAGVNLRTHVKFALKELSVESLDRYRAKLEMAVTELNNVVAKHGATLDSYVHAGKPCDAFWELALAVEQANRRARILTEECLKIQGLMEMTTFVAQRSWTGQSLIFPAVQVSGILAPNSIMGIKKQLMEQYVLFVNQELSEASKAPNRRENVYDGSNIQANILKHAAGTKVNYSIVQNTPVVAPNAAPLPAVQHNTNLVNTVNYAEEFHSKCGEWCCFQELTEPNVTWDKFRNGLATLTNTLTQASLTDFVSGITLPSGGAKTAFNWGEN